MVGQSTTTSASKLSILKDRTLPNVSEESIKRSESPTKLAESPTKRRASPALAELVEPPLLPQTRVADVFAPGMMRTPVFRIPSLLVLPKGLLLSFAEARPGWHDSGNINLVMRRSKDNGATWGAGAVVVEATMLEGTGGSATCGNPTPVYDAETGTIWLFLCTNHAEDPEWTIHAREGKDTRRVWLTCSTDQGRRWAAPKDLSSSLKLPSWTWYATGPCCGVQLSSGRMVVPANHAELVHEPRHPYLVERKQSRMVAHAIVSDDHGASWRLGGSAAPHTNECTVAALADGTVMLNARDWTGRFERSVQSSSDGGATWGPRRHDASLIEPKPQGCQGSMLAVPRAGAKGGEVLFFCNPASDKREMLTVRRSDDGGATWTASFVLEEGASAYSSLQLLGDGRLGVLYERADRISFASIPSHKEGPLGVF